MLKLGNMIMGSAPDKVYVFMKESFLLGGALRAYFLGINRK